jgi:hypothetical protein
VAELNHLQVEIVDELQGRAQKTPRGPQLLERVANDLVGMRAVELTAARLVGSYHDHIRRVERLDEAPVVRLSPADARRKIVRDKERPRCARRAVSKSFDTFGHASR